MGGESKARGVSALQVVLFILAAALVFVADEFSNPMAGEIGMVCLGLLIVTVGIDMVIKRLGVLRIDGWTEEKVVETYRGLVELLWALIFVGIGLAVATVVVVRWFDPSAPDSLWSNLLGSATGIGLILSGVGLIMLLNGLIRALAGSGRVDPQRLGGLSYFLDRVAGAVTFFLGILVSAVGLLLLVAPEAVTTTLKSIQALVPGS